MNSTPRIVVIGSSNTDLIVRLERIPKPGETLLGGDLISAAGGKGANQAVAAARAGGAVTFVARVGQDAWGEAALVGFAKDGIDTTYAQRDPESPSGAALIFVAASGENSIAVAQGANGRLSPADVDAARPVIKTAAAVVLQLESPMETVQAAAAVAAQAGVRVILNPAPARPLPSALLQNIHFLTPNETEAELLTGIPVPDEDGAARAAARLLESGVREAVVITMGRRGAFWATRDRQGFVPGFSVQAVDTTAAGDTFNGTLAVALAEGQDFSAAVRFACAAAALSVTRSGAQPSVPWRGEIEAFLAEQGTTPRSP